MSASKPRKPRIDRAPICGRTARQCANPACKNPNGTGHSRKKHKDGGPCAFAGCSCQKFIERPCANLVEGGGPCRFHGKNIVLRGPANPAFKTGRYSRYFSTIGLDLAGKTKTLESDPNLLSFRMDLAVIDEKLEQALIHGDGFTVADVDLLVNALAQERKTEEPGDQAVTDGLVSRLRLTANGQTDYLKILDMRRKLVSAEHGIQKLMLDSINSTQALALVSALAQAVIDHVSILSERQAIFAALHRIAGPGTVPADRTLSSGS